MNIFTERIIDKTFDDAIDQELLKKSQELYVLAVLRYLDEQKFQDFIHSDCPDIQDLNGEAGIEVTTADSNNDMRVSRESSRINNHAVEDKKYRKSVMTIESCGYTIHDTKAGKVISSPLYTGDTDKKNLQNAINRKIRKIEKYRSRFQNVGLAIIFQNQVSSDVCNDYAKWIQNCTEELKSECFDFYYVFCNRMVLYYDRKVNLKRIQLSQKEDKYLHIIARMAAEGDLSLSETEWQPKDIHFAFDPSDPPPLSDEQKKMLQELNYLSDEEIHQQAQSDTDCKPYE